MADVEKVMEERYLHPPRAWFGHPARLTVKGKPTNVSRHDFANFRKAGVGPRVAEPDPLPAHFARGAGAVDFFRTFII